MLDEYNKAVDNDGEKNFEFDLFEDKPKKTVIIDLEKDLDDSFTEENEMVNESNPYVINNEIEM